MTAGRDYDFDGVGEGLPRVEAWQGTGERVPGLELLAAIAAGNGLQMIWGRLEAYQSGFDVLELTIEAFDEYYYEVRGRTDVVERLRKKFKWAIGPDSAGTAESGG